jgi:hypothetical protein
MEGQDNRCHWVGIELNKSTFKEKDRVNSSTFDTGHRDSFFGANPGLWT